MGINVTDPQLGHGCVDTSLKAIKEEKKDVIEPYENQYDTPKDPIKVQRLSQNGRKYLQYPLIIKSMTSNQR